MLTSFWCSVMKMRRNQLILFICVILGVVSQSDCRKTKEMRRWRRETCDEGFYNTSTGMRCCRCDKGYYVKSDCTQMNGLSECEPCGPESFMDHQNYAKQCEICTVCLSNANMEIKSPCTASSNSVCRCREEHYCDEDQCKACHACDRCEGLGVKVPCSQTNNTLCKEPPQGIALAVIVLMVLAAVLTAVLIYLRKKEKFCFQRSTDVGTLEEMEKLKDVNLSPFLPEIAQALGLTAVLAMARHKGVVSETKIETEITNHPNNAEEQALKILHVWHEQRGLQGAYRGLVTTLRAVGKKAKADEVIKIVSRG